MSCHAVLNTLYITVYHDYDFHEQTVLKEYGAMQMESEVRVRELERALEDRADKLRVYERMEGELDQLVLDAAAIDDPTLAERILANYGTTAGTCAFITYTSTFTCTLE